MEYYQHDLALVHALGYSQHGDNCAPGILECWPRYMAGWCSSSAAGPAR